VSALTALRRNVWIEAPPAVFYVAGANEIPTEGVTDKDIISMQQAEIRHLRSELEKLRVTANTIANTCAVLSYLAQPPDQEWVTVPRDVREKMKDIKLSVRSTEEGTQVRWVTRSKDHTFEGRADG
jgi:hypothetical protein